MKKVLITKCLGLLAALGLTFALNGTAFAASGTVPYYSLPANGGNWTGTQYYMPDGSMTKDCFFFDGTYTYYLQTDGTPMKDRLTYHPDGEHIIYFDSDGHEKFSAFQYCPSVGYTCYFDSNGYIYKDVITFANGNTYYLDGNGKRQNSGWFQFANGRDYGFAHTNGALNDDGWGYDPWGRKVFYHWNGMVARGLITDNTWYYNMDSTDGHYLGQFPYTQAAVSTGNSTNSTSSGVPAGVQTLNPNDPYTLSQDTIDMWNQFAEDIANGNAGYIAPAPDWAK